MASAPTQTTMRADLGTRPSKRVVAGAALAALAGLLAVVALGARGPIAVLAGVVLIAMAGAPLLYRLREDRLDAPGIYAAMTVFTFAVTGLAWLGTPPTPGPWLTREDVAPAMVLVAAGLAAFAVGARITAGPARAPASIPALGDPPSWLLLALAYAGCLATMSAGLALNAYGYLATTAGQARLGPLAGVLPFVASLATVVILVTALAWLHSGQRALQRLLLAMVAVQVPAGFVAGVKGESVMPLLFVALAVVALGRRLPWKPVLAGIAMVFLFLVPANDAYRQSVRQPGSGPAALRAIGDPSAYRPDRTISDAVNFVAVRFRNIDHVALIKRDTGPIYAFGDGSTYTLLPLLIVVPRQVWEDKPVLDASGQFSRTYWEIPPSIRTAQPLTQAGDLYRNFGWTGPIAGLFLWGVALGAVQRLRARGPSLRATAVYLWSIPACIVYVEGDLPNTIATVTKSLPLVGLVAWTFLPGRDGRPGYRIAWQVIRGRVPVRTQPAD